VLLEVFGRDEQVPRVASQRNACNAVVVEGQWWIRVLQAFSLLGGAEEGSSACRLPAGGYDSQETGR